MDKTLDETDFEKHIGEIAETNARFGGWEKGHQVIVWRKLTAGRDPLVEVESRGRRGSCLLSELEFLGKFFEK